MPRSAPLNLAFVAKSLVREVTNIAFDAKRVPSVAKRLVHKLQNLATDAKGFAFVA